MPPKIFSFQFLSGTMLILFYVTIVFIGIFIPVHFDEVGWQYVSHRAIEDNFQLITLLPQCQPAESFAKNLPLLWYPHAWINYLLFMQIDNPLWTKIIGISRCLLFFSISWFIIKPLASDLKTTAGAVFILFLAIIGLDELPLLLQVSRPEQTALLAISTFLALALNASKIATYKYWKYPALILFILAALLLYPAHAKTIAALPIMAVCAAILFYRVTGSKWLAVISVILLSAFAISSVAIWMDRYACPSSVIGQRVINGHTLLFNKIFSDPLIFILAASYSFFTGLIYDFNIHIHVMRKFDWLPFTQSFVPDWLSFANDVYLFLVGCLRMIIFNLCLIISIKTLFILIKTRSSKTLNPQRIIGTFLFLSLCCLILCSGVNRMWYFPALQLPLLIIISLLFISSFQNLKFNHRFYTRAKYILVILAICNLAFLTYRYSPYIFKPELRFQAFTDHRPIHMQTPFNYGKTKELIEKAYAACELPPITEARHLFVDNSTYPTLKHSYEPFDFDYSTDIGANWELYENKNLFKLLDDYKSSGVIINCHGIPVTLKPYLLEYNGYCCASTAHINSIRAKDKK